MNQVAHLFWNFETLAIVNNRDPCFPFAKFCSQLYVGGLGVPARVSQCLLNNAKDEQLRIRCKTPFHTQDPYLHLNLILFFCFTSQPA